MEELKGTGINLQMAYPVYKEHRQQTLNKIPTIWSYQITASFTGRALLGRTKPPKSRTDEVALLERSQAKMLVSSGVPSRVKGEKSVCGGIRAVKLSPKHYAYDKIIQVKGDNFRNVLA